MDKTMEHNKAMIDLYKVKFQQIKMMKRQKFDTTEEEDLIFFREFNKKGMIEKFMAHYTNISKHSNSTISEAFSKIYINSVGMQKYCYYIPRSDSSTGHVLVHQIRKMFNTIGKIKNIIIIAPGKLGSDSNTALRDFPSYAFTSFMHEELLYDPFDNILVPDHIILDDKETREFLSKCKLQLSSLPIIWEMDPPAKRLAARHGQIIKIIRKIYDPDALVKETVTYRRVITAPKSKTKKK